MKKKEQVIHVQEDEAFLSGINLITGLKYNYDRPALSQNQLNALCMNQKITVKEKAVKILKSGQLLQRWALFERLPEYLKKPEDYEEVLHLIQKYFEDFQSMLDVIADGLKSCLQKIILSHNFQQKKEKINIQPFILTQKSEKSFFRLLMRSFTDEKYNKIALQSWSMLFDEFFIYLTNIKSPRLNQMIEECLQYIGGSFSMNTPPERRRIAFYMIKGLIEHSQKVKQRAKTKISFFNNDTNCNTRIVICQTMGKLLVVQPKNQEIRKYILDYFRDSEPEVRQKAFQILLKNPTQKNLQEILYCIQDQQDNFISTLLLVNMETFSLNFQQLIRSNKKFKTILMNFINSILKSQQDVEKTCTIIPMLTKIYYRFFRGSQQNMKSSNSKNSQEKSFNEIFMIEALDFENQQIFKALIILYKQSLGKYSEHYTHPFLIKTLNFYIHKYLTRSNKIKQHFCNSVENLKLYLSVFDYQNQQETNIYIYFLNKSVEQSKWPQVQFLLQQIKKAKIMEINFEKVSNILTKLIMSCPYYLVQEVSKAILYLILFKRKHLQFFLSIKEKLIVSKNWVHRKNYIALYAQIKAGTSYDFQKFIPIYNYKLLIKQKCVGVKLQFLKQAIKIYQSIDPISVIEKTSLKQTIVELASKDKDQDVLMMAKQTLKAVIASDKDIITIQKNLNRNSVFLQEQQKMRQKQALTIKKTKTQRQLARKDSKSKTITLDSRSSIRLPKDVSKEVKQSSKQIKQLLKMPKEQKLPKSLSTILASKKIDTKSEQQKHPVRMVRYSSAQIKNGVKLVPLKRQSGLGHTKK